MIAEVAQKSVEEEKVEYAAHKADKNEASKTAEDNEITRKELVVSQPMTEYAQKREEAEMRRRYREDEHRRRIEAKRREILAQTRATTALTPALMDSAEWYDENVGVKEAVVVGERRKALGGLISGGLMTQAVNEGAVLMGPASSRAQRGAVLQPARVEEGGRGRGGAESDLTVAGSAAPIGEEIRCDVVVVESENEIPSMSSTQPMVDVEENRQVKENLPETSTDSVVAGVMEASAESPVVTESLSDPIEETREMVEAAMLAVNDEPSEETVMTIDGKNDQESDASPLGFTANSTTDAERGAAATVGVVDDTADYDACSSSSASSADYNACSSSSSSSSFSADF